MNKQKAAVLGSGNIGTDLMIKVLRGSRSLEVVALVGIDPDSDGLARARRMGVTAVDDGIEGLLRLPEFDEITTVFDATSARAHEHHRAALAGRGKRLIDLTPAAVGPYVVPPVNLDRHPDASDINMVTCGGQATIPVVAAVARAAPVHYAEIVAALSSSSAGPGTRANIDEFTETTARAIEQVGGAARGKAMIVLNPADPPLIMRDTVHCLTGRGEPDRIVEQVRDMVRRVQQYVPGYRLKHDVQLTPLDNDSPLRALAPAGCEPEWKASVFLEVEGAAHYLPAHAGNLDIMTAAALRTAEQLAENDTSRSPAP